ncbi:MAG: hypothetical protein RRY52_07740 [Anaerovoracaceae bacterium]
MGNMKKWRWLLVKKKTLLGVAGTVWLVAGFNVARLGIMGYGELPVITWIQILLSIIVFCGFGGMFYKMSGKHSKRITGYDEEKKPIWSFFDVKGYCIMAFMMGGGIWFRSSGLAPTVFVAIFYTGLGCALAVAGIKFWGTFFMTKGRNNQIFEEEA